MSISNKSRKLVAIAFGLALMSSVSTSAFAMACMDEPNETLPDCENACKYTLLAPWVYPFCL